MVDELTRYTAAFADVLGAIFNWWVVILAFVQCLRQGIEVDRFQGWLRRGVLVGLIGSVMGLVATAAWLIGTASNSDVELRASLVERLSGPYAWGYWLSVATQLLLIALLMVARSRASWWLAWAVALFMSLPFERLVIIVTSLHRDYLPSGWTMSHVVWSVLLLPVLLLLSAPIMWYAQRRRRTAGVDQQVR